jgi:hypothetical protein
MSLRPGGTSFYLGQNLDIPLATSSDRGLFLFGNLGTPTNNFGTGIKMDEQE